jgi:hypothetical protein
MINVRRPSTSSLSREKRCGPGHIQHMERRIPYSSNAIEYFLGEPQLYTCLIKSQV